MYETNKNLATLKFNLLNPQKKRFFYCQLVLFQTPQNSSCSIYYTTLVNLKSCIGNISCQVLKKKKLTIFTKEIPLHNNHVFREIDLSCYVTLDVLCFLITIFHYNDGVTYGVNLQGYVYLICFLYNTTLLL